MSEAPNADESGAYGFAIRDIQNMSPDVAKEALAAMQARFRSDNPTDTSTREGTLSMTPAEATAKLAEIDLAGRPTDAEGKPIPKAPEQVIVSSHEVFARQNAELLTELEANGFPARGTPVGDDLHNMMEGRTPVTPEFEMAVRAKHKQCMADKGWCQLLLNGDQKATRDFHTMNAILTAVEIQRPTRIGKF